MYALPTQVRSRIRGTAPRVEYLANCMSSVAQFAKVQTRLKCKLSRFLSSACFHPNVHIGSSRCRECIEWVFISWRSSRVSIGRFDEGTYST